MARNHNPIQQLTEAKQIARDFGMFIVEKAGSYLLYRRCTPKNIYLGKRGTTATLRAFVERCAYKPTPSSPAERRAVMQ